MVWNDRQFPDLVHRLYTRLNGTASLPIIPMLLLPQWNSLGFLKQRTEHWLPLKTLASAFIHDYLPGLLACSILQAAVHGPWACLTATLELPDVWHY